MMEIKIVKEKSYFTLLKTWNHRKSELNGGLPGDLVQLLRFKTKNWKPEDEVVQELANGRASTRTWSD